MVQILTIRCSKLANLNRIKVTRLAVWQKTCAVHIIIHFDGNIDSFFNIFDESKRWSIVALRSNRFSLSSVHIIFVCASNSYDLKYCKVQRFWFEFCACFFQFNAFLTELFKLCDAVQCLSYIRCTVHQLVSRRYKRVSRTIVLIVNRNNHMTSFPRCIAIVKGNKVNRETEIQLINWNEQLEHRNNCI